MIEKELTIGEVSQRTGLAPSAIRFYEDRGLIHPRRNAAGQRRYLRADLRRLGFVMIAQKCGFTLPRIRQELERLPQGRTPGKADWARIARGFRREIDERLGALTRLRDKLDGCIGCGCLSLRACALYNPEDRAGLAGAGPRYLMGDAAQSPQSGQDAARDDESTP